MARIKLLKTYRDGTTVPMFMERVAWENMKSKGNTFGIVEIEEKREIPQEIKNFLEKNKVEEQPKIEEIKAEEKPVKSTPAKTVKPQTRKRNVNKK